MKPAIYLVVFTGLIICSWAAQIQVASPQAQEDVRRFLVGYVESHHMEVDEARYAVGFVDLNEDGTKEAVVYLMGRDWCGTAGCQTLVLSRLEDSYRLVGRILATRPPIRTLDRKAHGWHTISAWVRGAGVSDFEAEFPFDGNSYPTSAAPGYASRLKTKAEGEVIIPSSATDIRNEHALSKQR